MSKGMQQCKTLHYMTKKVAIATLKLHGWSTSVWRVEKSQFACNK